MFGGLHIEKALWSNLVDMLDCFRWISVLTEATVSKSGTSELYLKAAHITRTRKAHEITALALIILQKKAYESFESALPKVSFELWQKDTASKSSIVLEFCTTK